MLGALCVLLTLLLTSGGVQAVRAESEVAPPVSAVPAPAEGVPPAAPMPSVPSTSPMPGVISENPVVPVEEHLPGVIVLNTRGYNYGPKRPQIDPLPAE